MIHFMNKANIFKNSYILVLINYDMLSCLISSDYFEGNRMLYLINSSFFGLLNDAVTMFTQMLIENDKNNLSEIYTSSRLCRSTNSNLSC